MSKIVQRLAELLDKDKITIQERSEAIALAQSAFGTQALVVKNDILNQITSKPVDQKADKPAAAAKAPAPKPVEVTTNDVESPAEAQSEKPQPASEPRDVDVAPEADRVERDGSEPLQFTVGGDTYVKKIRTDGLAQYRKNGKLVSKDEFETAEKEAKRG